MNLDKVRIVLRQRSLAEVLDLSCRLCCSTGLQLFVRLSLWTLLPGLLLCLAFRYGFNVPWAVIWLLAFSWATFFQGVFTIASGQVIFSETLTARHVMGLFYQRVGPYLGSWLFSRLYLAIASLLLITLPFAWIQSLHVYEISLLEQCRASDAFKRSQQIVRHRSGTVFQVLVLLLLAHAGFVVALELLADGVVNKLLQLGSPFGTLMKDGGSPYALLGFFLAIPFTATARFLYYIDARTRADGWDIQLRFMAIRAKAQKRRWAG